MSLDTRARRAAATAIVTVLATLLALVLIEGATRALFPAFDPSGQLEFDYKVGPLFLARPNTTSRQAKNTGDFDVAISINRHGLRDSADIATARADDLIVVGDSIAFGWGVEEHERVSNQIQSMTGRRTFNLAALTDFDGYDELLSYVASLGAAIGQIVLIVSMETDLHIYGSASVAESHGPAWLDTGIDDLRDWLGRNSAAYIMALTVVHQTPWLNELAVRAGLIIPNLEGMRRNVYSRDVIESAADRLHQMARRYRTLVVIAPSRGLWVGPNRIVEDRVHREFVSALRLGGLDVVDPRPLLENGNMPLSYHFANDGHWNARGHRLIAGLVAERLEITRSSN